MVGPERPAPAAKAGYSTVMTPSKPVKRGVRFSTRPLALAPAAVAVFLLSAPVRSETLQAPQGGRAISIGQNRVVCGSLPAGWTATSDRKSVRPPESVGQVDVVEVAVANEIAACARSKVPVSLVVTKPWPQFDPAATVFFPDEGRLDVKGSGLEGAQFFWQAPDRSGQQTCLGSVKDGKVERCTIPVDRNLPSDTVLRWLPVGAKDGADVTTFDAEGNRVSASALTLQPARIVLGQVFPTVETLDISQGIGTLPLVHPKTVAAVDCGLARCDLNGGDLLVRGVPPPATQVSIIVRLAPRVFLAKGTRLDTSASATFTVSRCQMAVVSGPPVREAEEPRILVKMLDRCRSNARLRWLVDTTPAEVVREVRSSDGDYVLLRTSSLASGSVTITASRADAAGGVIGSVVASTMRSPRPLATLDLPGHGPIDFVPTNRDAVWSVGGILHGKLVPLEVGGVYTIRADKDRTLIRGERGTSGFTSLRYAYRRDDLPKGFDDVNLAIITESIQRPLRQASVPAPFAASATHKAPLAEFLCATKGGGVAPLPSGVPLRIPFFARDTCRVVIHQERLLPEEGDQEIVLDIEVTKANGSKRSDASVSERMVLHSGGEPRVFFLKGVTEQFDQVVVRLSHVVDETRYVLGAQGRQTPPSLQWSATVEGGRVRLYVSLNVPAGLYRINEPAASLTLNFGVLGRLTWLDRQGKEGLVGLETGVLGASLIPQQYNNSPPFPPTLVTLLGLGLRVEVGQGAAVGVHLWGAYEFRSQYNYGSDSRAATHWSLLFGPSISIGNVGTNL
jgi:hypothetical protein